MTKKLLQKIINLVGKFFQGQIIFDFPILGMNRKRHFKVPTKTNYIRISNFELIVEEIINNNIQGAVAEVGVYKGEFAKYINKAFPKKTLYLFDTFEGFNQNDIAIEKQQNFSNGNQNFSNTSIEEVLAKMEYKSNCIIKKGYFPESLEGLDEKFCFVSLDADLYKPIYDGLEYFYPRLESGGYIFIHDYNNDLYAGAKQAVKEFCKKNQIPHIPITDSWGSTIIAK